MMNIFIIVMLNICTICSNVFIENLKTFFTEDISEKNKIVKIKEYINNLQRIKDEDKYNITQNMLSFINNEKNINRFSRNISVIGNPYEIDKFEDSIFITTRNIINMNIFSNEEDLKYIVEFLFLQDKPYPKNELNFWMFINPLLQIVIDNEGTKNKHFLQRKEYDIFYVKLWTMFSILNELRQNNNYCNSYKMIQILKHIISYHTTNKIISQKEIEDDQNDKTEQRIAEDDNAATPHKEFEDFYTNYLHDLYFYSMNNTDGNTYNGRITGIFEVIFMKIIFIERIMSYVLFLIFNINTSFILHYFCPHLIFIKWIWKLIYNITPSQSLLFLNKQIDSDNRLVAVIIDMIVWCYIFIALTILIYFIFQIFFKFVDLCCLFNQKRIDKVKKKMYVILDVLDTSKWNINIINVIYYGCRWLNNSFLSIWPISWCLKKIISSCNHYINKHYNDIFFKEIFNMYLCKNVQNTYNQLNIIYVIFSEFEEKYLHKIKEYEVITRFMKAFIKNIDNVYFKTVKEKEEKNYTLYCHLFYQIFSQELQIYYNNINNEEVKLTKTHYSNIEENFHHLVKDNKLNVNDFILNIFIEMMNFLRLDKKYLFSNEFLLSILIHRMYIMLSDEDKKLEFFSIIKNEKDIALQEYILNVITYKTPKEIMEYVFGKMQTQNDKYLEAGDVENALWQSQHSKDKDIVVDEEYKEHQKQQEEKKKHDNEIYNQCLQQIQNLHHHVHSISSVRNFIKSSIKISIITSIIFCGFKFKHLILYFFKQLTVKIKNNKQNSSKN